MRPEPKIKRKSEGEQTMLFLRVMKQAVDTSISSWREECFDSFRAMRYMVKDWVTILAATVCTLETNPLVAQSLFY